MSKDKCIVLIVLGCLLIANGLFWMTFPRLEYPEVKKSTVETEPAETMATARESDVLGFEKVCVVGQDIYLREKLTDVMYVWCQTGYSDYKTSGMSVMMDPETGGPLTYTNWQRYLEGKGNG